MSANTPDTSQALLSIGAVSKATGIPSETLRTWERRYQYPRPVRSPKGQRLYAPETVEALNLVTQGLDSGHKPRQLLGRSVGELKDLLGISDEPLPRIIEPPDMASQEPILSWVRAARELDGETLEEGFRSAWYRLGAVEFLTQRVYPFLIAVGNAWARGELTVLHEHFTSERLRDFLAGIWRPLNSNARGPNLVLACLPGEQHCLGLHMTAVLAVISGFRLVFLGANTPLESIAEASVQSDALAVLISVSQATVPATCAEQLRTLDALLPPHTRLILGGAGSPAQSVPRAQHLNSLDALNTWIKTEALKHKEHPEARMA